MANDLLTETHLEMLRSRLQEGLPVPEDDRFDALIRSLDHAGRKHGRSLLRSKWAKAGAVLIILNEIRGVVFVGSIVSAWF